jgi:nitronate monooxygenase
MPISTPLTNLLGIAHPILLAPMDLVADGRLAASVTQAGGLGLIGGGYGDAAWLEREFAAAGGTRVGVGFITWSLARNPSLLDLVLERQPVAVMLSFGEVTPFADRIRKAGARLICQVQTVEQARSAAAAGVDVVVAQGGEAGGHGIARGTFALVPAVCDAVRDIPVVAAGGVADGRGLAAALMLGAAGVLVGTRFYATAEAGGAQAAKQAIVDGSGDKTIRSILFDIARRNVWPSPYTGRVLQNEFSERWRGREAELVQRHDEVERYATARAAGDYRTAAVIAGECADLVGDIPPAGEVVRRMIREAEGLLAGASNRFTLDRGPEPGTP